MEIYTHFKHMDKGKRWQGNLSLLQGLNQAHKRLVKLKACYPWKKESNVGTARLL